MIIDVSGRQKIIIDYICKVLYCNQLVICKVRENLQTNMEGIKLRMVPGAGIEPARCFHRGILSPLRLPISPSGHI